VKGAERGGIKIRDAGRRREIGLMGRDTPLNIGRRWRQQEKIRGEPQLNRKGREPWEECQMQG